MKKELKTDPKVKTGIYHAPWEKSFDLILTTFEEFIHRQTTSGLLLMGMAIVALASAGIVLDFNSLGVAELPKDTRFTQISGVSLLAGIGFTMSIFVAQLGFAEHEDLLLMAKTGILAASLLAGIAGFIWLYLVSKPVAGED